MTALEMTEKVQDGMLKAVEASQRWTLGALRSSTSAFDGMMPDLSWMPFADKLPTPGESVDAAFAFAGRVLDAEHAFCAGLVKLPSSAD